MERDPGPRSAPRSLGIAGVEKRRPFFVEVPEVERVLVLCAMLLADFTRLPQPEARGEQEKSPNGVPARHFGNHDNARAGWREQFLTDPGVMNLR